MQFDSTQDTWFGWSTRVAPIRVWPDMSQLLQVAYGEAVKGLSGQIPCVRIYQPTRFLSSSLPALSNIWIHRKIEYSSLKSAWMSSEGTVHMVISQPDVKSYGVWSVDRKKASRLSLICIVVFSPFCSLWVWMCASLFFYKKNPKKHSAYNIITC